MAKDMKLTWVGRLAGFGLIASLAGIQPALAQPVFPLADPDENLLADACFQLNEIELPELASIIAEWNPEGPAVVPALAAELSDRPVLAAHCRVRGRIEPSIGFEVWLPAAIDWNGRFLAVGGGGFAGSISYGRMAPLLNQGYATASTDTGHEAGAFEWLADDALLRDFAYRAIYEMTAKAGVIVANFYERPADYRYFNGCSRGGNEGLMEAQRFPGDYDGIVAGAPANAFVELRTTQLWGARSAQPFANGQSLLGPDALALVTAAATAQCDTLDGVADGVLEDPRRCNFDPGRLQCGFSNAGSCLTAPQVSAIRNIYQGPNDPATGPIAPGLAVGSEPQWIFTSRADLSRITLEFFRRVVFDDPFWNWRSFDFSLDHSFTEQEAAWLLNATSPDLSDYRDRGGKLLLYHGWNDASISPEATIAYYEDVEAALALEPNPLDIATGEFARLFMVPGMAHCAGGIGTSEFDAQRAIENWVERGIAPDRIEAERVENGQVVRTRPLCPYPQTARYRGTGNSDRSGNFVCSE